MLVLSPLFLKNELVNEFVLVSFYFTQGLILYSVSERDRERENGYNLYLENLNIGAEFLVHKTSDIHKVSNITNVTLSPFKILNQTPGRGFM